MVDMSGYEPCLTLVAASVANSSQRIFNRAAAALNEAGWDSSEDNDTSHEGRDAVDGDGGGWEGRVRVSWWP